jgi:predicted Zn-dependent protease
MKQFFARLWRWLWCRPRLAVPGVLLIVLAGFLASVQLYAWRHYQLARQARIDLQLESARDHIQRCLRVWPWSVNAHILAARIARYESDYTTAEEHLEECKRLSGGMTADIQLEWTQLRAMSGELDSVVPGLWRCVEEDHPERFEVLETLAVSYRRELNMRMALACLHRWLNEQPDNFRALILRAEILTYLEKPEGIKRDLVHALEIKPDDIETGIRLVQFYLIGYQAKELKPYLARLERLAPDDLRVKLLSAQAARYDARQEEALALVNEVLEKEPDNYEAMQLRGSLALETGHPAEAEMWFRKAVAKEPGNLQLLHNLHRALNAQPSRKKEAEQVLAEHQKLSEATMRLSKLLQESSHRITQDANVAAELGNLFLQVQREASGLYYLETAVRLDPRQDQARRTLIAHYERSANQEYVERAKRHRMQLESAALEALTKPTAGGSSRARGGSR